MGEGSRFPILHTERLVLREVTVSDAEWYLAHFSDPEIVHGQGFAGPADIEGARTELQEFFVDLRAQGHGIRWGLCLRGRDELIGSAGFYAWVREPQGQVELGYDLVPSLQGRGLMREALEAILDYASGELGVERFVATVLTHNDSSCHLLERLGFERRGLLPEHGPDEHGVMRDEYLFVLEG